MMLWYLFVRIIRKNVLILGLNQVARDLLKYEEKNLLNKPLINILSTRAADNVKNYLEYTENGHDLLDILPKVIDFSLIDAKEKISGQK